MPEQTSNTPPPSGMWLDLLHDPSVSESGGAENNEGVDFSRYWAISQLLELEQTAVSDYALLFEYLQDVLVIDSAGEPKKGTLYQVKKKAKGSWTIALLCKKTKSKKPPKTKKTTQLAGSSPIGKLLVAANKLSKCLSVEGVFLSNAVCDLKLSSGKTIPTFTRTRIGQLCSEHAGKIERKLARELRSKQPIADLKLISFEQTKLPPATMRETAVGMAQSFLMKHNPAMQHVCGRLVEKLHEAFSIASGPKTGITSLNDIVAQKGFTRARFTALLGELSKTRPFPDALTGIIEGLKHEGMPPRTADRVSSEAARLKIEMTRRPDVKEALQWQKAIDLARSQKTAESYRLTVESIASAIAHRGVSDLPADTVLAIAVLAINYVDEESATLN